MKGFTLIETLLYFGLFAMLAGGGIAATYGIIVSTARSADRVAIASEADFLSAKVDWMLAGLAASDVMSPTSGASGTLEVSRSGTTLRLEARETDATLTRGAGTASVLNGGGVHVSALRFTRSVGPDAVTTSFTLSASSSGPVVSQGFTFTNYLLP